ncbi:methyltransferase [Vogesella fluminis]|uniref:O-methyltransferase n=1 Tax=Vogesella fluminis TaxID=1069161 RepID=A0ABQ3H9I7_9NEIS|nr:class I SAM-dependent methyltransferase [Vogesella fluminis]GHD72645.1 O-methyltransferase [Vogesella fluminis]
MQFQHPHPLQPCWDLALASVQADALATALNVGLFDVLTEQSGAPEIAARLGLDPDKLEHILELLWSMDLLELIQIHAGTASTPRYCASSGAKRYFAKHSPDYCGDAWAFRLRSLREFGAQLSDHLQLRANKEEPPPSVPTDQCWATLARTKIVQEQAAVTAGAALAIVDRLPELKRVRHFLDLGCGPGMVAIALAHALPESHGTVFDLPPTAAVARQNIEAAQLGARLSVLGGDLTRDDIGHGYDLIWCASVLHFVPDLAQTLRKIRAALAPGGLLISIHAEIPPLAPQAATVLAYYLPLLMRGHHVGRQGELAGALLAAGFDHVGTFESDLFPLAPVQVQVCR